jgi:hypothetical protein
MKIELFNNNELLSHEIAVLVDQLRAQMEAEKIERIELSQTWISVEN